MREGRSVKVDHYQSSLLSRERPFAQTNPATKPTADGVDLLENYTNINRQLRDYFQ